MPYIEKLKEAESARVVKITDEGVKNNNNKTCKTKSNKFHPIER